MKGFEPSTLGSTIRCSNQLSYTHRKLSSSSPRSAPEGIRTPDLRLRRPLLYPTELLAPKKITSTECREEKNTIHSETLSTQRS